MSLFDQLAQEVKWHGRVSHSQIEELPQLHTAGTAVAHLRIIRDKRTAPHDHEPSFRLQCRWLSLLPNEAERIFNRHS